ncbi:MAG: zf-HC2 domain-containing protein, partial [Acidobacteria bacterium]|nr:zf-HC2 domain-containing protein [Acidobacteriota bacterium]
MTHEEHKELLPLAALGATDEREQGALDAHLAACGECRAELRSLHDTAALLALDAAPVAPRPELRSRVLSEIKSVRQETAARGETRRPAKVVSLEEARAARRGDDRAIRPARRPAFLYGALAAS